MNKTALVQPRRTPSPSAILISRLPRPRLRRLSGSEADIIGDLCALRDMGVTALDIDFGRPHAAAVIAEMRRFKEVVLSHL